MGNQKSKGKNRGKTTEVLKQDLNQQQFILKFFVSKFQCLSSFQDEEEIFLNKIMDDLLKNLLVLVQQQCNQELRKDILKLTFKHNIEDFFVPALNCNVCKRKFL